MATRVSPLTQLWSDGIVRMGTGETHLNSGPGVQCLTMKVSTVNFSPLYKLVAVTYICD